MPLGSADVHVWYRLLDGLTESDESAALSLLSSEERARADRFLVADARQTFVHAHALLRTVLSTYTGKPPLALRFVTGTSGKPALHREDGRLQFNLSHATGLVACAVSQTDVGIDVETLDRRVSALDLASRFFSEREVAWLSRARESDRLTRFLELWTLKEAYVKGIGKGLSQPLNSFGFGLDALPGIRFTGPTLEESDAWRFALYAPTPGYRLAVAARCREGATPNVVVQPPEPEMLLLGRS